MKDFDLTISQPVVVLVLLIVACILIDRYWRGR
jgi:hypothetical protein